MKKVLGNLLLLFISLSLSLLVAEFALRKMIFSHAPAFKKFRFAGSYANSANDQDYWTLYSMFEENNRPPKNPHPLLGWIGDFDRGSLLHNKAAGIRTKRPVLLYGDSYAQCLNAECFQEFLNNDTAFAKNNYFLNYGVGGFGVDQIYLMMHNTAFHYKNPYVIFSLMVADLDRSILTFRTGQKPKFEIQHDSLVLTNVPVDPDGEHYIKNHPPHIRSYVWRLFLYSRLNKFPKFINDKLTGDEKYIPRKIKLNENILQKAIDELRANHIDFSFVVFHNVQRKNKEFSMDNDNDWRDKFLLDFLHKNNVPYIWSKELIRTDTAYTKTNLKKYIHGHPTSYFNRLMSDKMKQAVLENEKNAAAQESGANQSQNYSWYYLDRIQEIEKTIQNDSTSIKKFRDLSQKTNQNIEDIIFSESVLLFNKQYEGNKQFPLK